MSREQLSVTSLIYNRRILGIINKKEKIISRLNYSATYVLNLQLSPKLPEAFGEMLNLLRGARMLSLITILEGQFGGKCSTTGSIRYGNFVFILIYHPCLGVVRNKTKVFKISLSFEVFKRKMF